MTGKRLLLALAAAALAFLPARAGAENELPLGDGRYGRVRFAWVSGSGEAHAFVPVWVTLRNPDPRERSFRLVLVQGTRRKEAQVSLAPGGKKRIGFTVPAEEGISFELSEGATRVVDTPTYKSLVGTATILLLDGEADTNRLVEARGVANDTALCLAEDAPTELGCLAPFHAVVLRRVDPSRLDPGARAALDDYVRIGGTLIVNATGAVPATALAFSESAGTAEAGSDLPTKRRGLGRVVLADEDDISGSTAGAAEFRKKIAPLLLSASPPRWPPFFVASCQSDAGNEASFALGGFFLAYILVAGPGFFFLLRGAKPGRVAVCLVILLVLATALGAGAALVVRVAAGRVEAVSFVLVPSGGDPVAFGDVAVASGGSRHHDLEVEGVDVAATAEERLARTDRYYRWGLPAWNGSAVSTRRPERGARVEFRNHAVTPFAESHFGIVASAPGRRPLEAWVEPDPDPGAPKGSLRVVVTNTTGHDLGETFVHDTLASCAQAYLGRFPGVRFEKIKAGETVTKRLEGLDVNTTYSWNGRRFVPVMTFDNQLIGLPRSLEVVGWEQLLPAGRTSHVPDFVLLAEDEPPFHVRASNALVKERSWRVEEVAARVAPLPAWLGVKVVPAQGAVRVVSVEPGSPAAATTFLVPNAEIASVNNVPVRTPEDLEHVLGRIGAGHQITIRSAPDANEQMVKLAAPPGTAPADGSAPESDDGK